MSDATIAIDGRTIADHFPGIGRYVYRLVAALAEEAPEARLLLLHCPDQPNRRFDLGALAAKPNVRLLPVAAPVFSAASQWRVPAALRAGRAAAFHATYWVTPYRPGRPTALSVYDLVGLQARGAVPGPRRRALALALRLALRSAREVLTLSEWSKGDLVARLGLPPERITVTPLAPDPAFRPPPAEAVEALAARLGLHGRYVLYVGSNKPHKNLVTLVEAWSMLAPRLAEAPATLLVAGPWDARYDEARRLAAALPPAAATRFLGPVTEADLPALYGGAALFAFPSRYEGFGLPPLEAMACGTPVVSANATSLAEVAGDAALLVPPDDAHAWATALWRLLADAGLARELAERGQRRAAGFTWAETARRTLDVYRRLVGPPGSAAAPARSPQAPGRP